MEYYSNVTPQVIWDSQKYFISTTQICLQNWWIFKSKLHFSSILCLCKPRGCCGVSSLPAWWRMNELGFYQIHTGGFPEHSCTDLLVWGQDCSILTHLHLIQNIWTDTGTESTDVFLWNEVFPRWGPVGETSRYAVRICCRMLAIVTCLLSRITLWPSPFLPLPVMSRSSWSLNALALAGATTHAKYSSSSCSSKGEWVNVYIFAHMCLCAHVYARVWK